mmetsp:Transcript_61000/g.176627  ORF Transcript_61000/g.176627 Transcript_61000/m.176627 type:complete len:268 (+) Transcript_61000:311-1114(+)
MPFARGGTGSELSCALRWRSRLSRVSVGAAVNGEFAFISGPRGVPICFTRVLDNDKMRFLHASTAWRLKPCLSLKDADRCMGGVVRLLSDTLSPSRSMENCRAARATSFSTCSWKIGSFRSSSSLSRKAFSAAPRFSMAAARRSYNSTTVWAIFLFRSFSAGGVFDFNFFGGCAAEPVGLTAVESWGVDVPSLSCPSTLGSSLPETCSSTSAGKPSSSGPLPGVSGRGLGVTVDLAVFWPSMASAFSNSCTSLRRSRNSSSSACVKA